MQNVLTGSCGAKTPALWAPARCFVPMRSRMPGNCNTTWPNTRSGRGFSPIAQHGSDLACRRRRSGRGWRPPCDPVFGPCSGCAARRAKVALVTHAASGRTHGQSHRPRHQHTQSRTPSKTQRCDLMHRIGWAEAGLPGLFWRNLGLWLKFWSLQSSWHRNP